ncbi:MAG: hypothetical protein IPK78_04280 [Rhodospirillales bacterium]|nr:hypothetical protein [Rhodospirillales bacterium]
MPQRQAHSVIPPRDKSPGFADFLNWGSLIADGVVLGKDGSLIAGWRLAGPDSLALPDHDRNALSDRMNTALLGLGAGWAMWYDVSRIRVAEYPIATRSAFPDRISRMVDDERRRQFDGGLDLFESVHTLVLQFVPSRDQVRRLGHCCHSRRRQRGPRRSPAGGFREGAARRRDETGRCARPAADAFLRGGAR